MSTDGKSGLQLRSLIKKGGELEISLLEVPTPEPSADEVVVRGRGITDQSFHPLLSLRFSFLVGGHLTIALK